MGKLQSRRRDTFASFGLRHDVSRPLLWVTLGDLSEGRLHVIHDLCHRLWVLRWSWQLLELRLRSGQAQLSELDRSVEIKKLESRQMQNCTRD